MILLTIYLVTFMIKFGNVLCQGLSRGSPESFCTDLNPQHSLDMDQLMGMWFVNEIITHLEEPTGEHYYETCIGIHLSDITEQMHTYRPKKRLDNDGGVSGGGRRGSSSSGGGGGSSSGNGGSIGAGSHTADFIGDYYGSDRTRQSQQYKYLRLIWDENESTLEYTLKYNVTRRGFWIASGPQKGTMLNLPYSQFGGTVQVIKAVGDHLVLTFCQRTDDQLFTLILTRRPNTLTAEEVQSVRTLLKRRNLSTATVRKVCKNNSNNIRVQNIIILFIGIVPMLCKWFS